MNSLLSEAQAMAPALIAMKEDLHRHPELAFHEHRTTALLRTELTALGLELIELGMETGVVAVLRGGKPGGAVALRADIDAIAQQERSEGVRSETDGVMHGCGHDFHTTCLWGAARLLASRRKELCGAVIFLFQPAEEITQGARAMVDHGLWEKLPQMPQCLFGLHNRPQLPAGQVAVMEGPVMSGKSHFSVTLHGRAGHGGSPHQCVDVIVPGAGIVSALQTVVSRGTDPLESLVCAVCSIHAGTPENFVPDTLTLTGSIRAHSPTVHRAAEEQVRKLSTGIAAAHGCTAEVVITPDVPATRNSPQMTALARRTAVAVAGPVAIVSPPPDMGSEDFAVLAETVPAFFYWLGSGYSGRENPGWHSDCFRTDDSALPLGAALLAQSALEALRRSEGEVSSIH